MKFLSTGEGVIASFGNVWLMIISRLDRFSISILDDLLVENILQVFIELVHILMQIFVKSVEICTVCSLFL